MSSDSETPSEAVDRVDVTPTKNRSCPSKTKKKVPKRIHKAEREKLKREQLNDLFLDLASAIELNQPNMGKASVLSEATRLLKDLLGQLEFLKKEHDTLLSESQYVTVENNELKEENSALETQIGKLQVELETKVRQSQPDLNVPPSEFQQELTPHFEGEFLPVMDGTVQPRVFVVPIEPDLQSSQVASPHVSKPRARYPTPADSWPSKLLGEQLHCQEGNSA